MGNPSFFYYIYKGDGGVCRKSVAERSSPLASLDSLRVEETSAELTRVSRINRRVEDTSAELTRVSRINRRVEEISADLTRVSRTNRREEEISTDLTRVSRINRRGGGFGGFNSG